jgi:hypothetical protein
MVIFEIYSCIRAKQESVRPPANPAQSRSISNGHFLVAAVMVHGGEVDDLRNTTNVVALTPSYPMAIKNTSMALSCTR